MYKTSGYYTNFEFYNVFYEELLLIFLTRKSIANYIVSINRKASWENNNQTGTVLHGIYNSFVTVAHC